MERDCNAWGFGAPGGPLLVATDEGKAVEGK